MNMQMNKIGCFICHWVFCRRFAPVFAFGYAVASQVQGSWVQGSRLITTESLSIQHSMLDVRCLFFCCLFLLRLRLRRTCPSSAFCLCAFPCHAQPKAKLGAFPSTFMPFLSLLNHLTDIPLNDICIHNFYINFQKQFQNV